jgi:hypothetical protein
MTKEKQEVKNKKMQKIVVQLCKDVSKLINKRLENFDNANEQIALRLDFLNNIVAYLFFCIALEILTLTHEPHELLDVQNSFKKEFEKTCEVLFSDMKSGVLSSIMENYEEIISTDIFKKN